MGSLQPPIPPATMPLISPSALLHAHISQTPSLRPSRRQPTEPRPIDLNIGALTHTNGSSLVRIGATTIVCGVRAEILSVADIPSYSASSNRRNRSGNDDDDHDDEEEEEDDDDYIRLFNLLVPNLELSTGCSPLHPANAAPSIEAQSLSQRLLSLLHSSRLVRQADLEITYAPPQPSPLSPDVLLDDSIVNPETITQQQQQLKAFWVLYIDMVCLSHGGSGSVFDAAWLAMYAALRHTRLPQAVWDADSKQIYCSPDVGEARSLRLRGMPVPLSFGVFVPDKAVLTSTTSTAAGADADAGAAGVGATCLVDLDTFEEESVSERGCVVVDLDPSDSGQLVLHRVEKSGGSAANASASAIGLSEIKVLAGIANIRRSHWEQVLKSSLSSSSSTSAVQPG